MLINTALDNYLIYRSASNIRISSLKLYKRTLAQFFAMSAITDTNQLTYSLIVSHLNDLRNKPLKDNTVRTCRNIIVSFVKYMNIEGIVNLPDVNKRTPTIRVDKERPAVMTTETLRRFMDAVELSTRYHGFTRARNIAMMWLLKDCGLREGELIHLKLTDVDMQSRLISVSSESKSRKPRVIPFTQDCCNKLRAYLRLRGDNTCKYLFITNRGKYPAQTYIYKLVVRYARAAGLPDIHPHTFRHTFATNALQSGVSLNSVKTLLGHSSITTTLIYAHGEEEHSIEEYRKALG